MNVTISITEADILALYKYLLANNRQFKRNVVYNAILYPFLINCFSAF